MEIIKLNSADVELAVPLAANFRVALNSYKGILSQPNIEAGKEELLEYIETGFPMYAAVEGGKFVGYLVCRVDEPTLWIESIYVLDNYRRHGVASLLLEKAESLAKSYGEDTVFNYVHPNNIGMIAFLNKHGYTVLNLIEIRKPFSGEKLSTRIRVGDSLFDY